MVLPIVLKMAYAPIYHRAGNDQEIWPRPTSFAGITGNGPRPPGETPDRKSALGSQITDDYLTPIPANGGAAGARRGGCLIQVNHDGGST